MESLDEFIDQEVDTTDKWRKVRGNWSRREDYIIFESHQDDENAEGLFLCDIPLADGQISAQVSIIGSPEDVTDPCAQIVFHYLDYNDFYVAGIGGWQSLYTIGRKLPPEMVITNPKYEKLIVDGHNSHIKKYRWYPVTVSFADGEIELRLSNIPIFRIKAGYGRFPGFFGFRGFGNCPARYRIDRIVRKIRRSDVGARLANPDLSLSISMNSGTLPSVTWQKYAALTLTLHLKQQSSCWEALRKLFC